MNFSITPRTYSLTIKSRDSVPVNSISNANEFYSDGLKRESSVDFATSLKHKNQEALNRSLEKCQNVNLELFKEQT